MDSSAVLGFLFPGHSAEDDYPLIAGMISPSLTVHVEHTTLASDEITEEAVRANANLDFLFEAARKLAEYRLDSVMWACTSSSFHDGLAAAQDQAVELQRFIGVPTSSTSLAFLAAHKHLGLRKVAIASPYPEPVTTLFRNFLAEGGIDAVRVNSLGASTGEAVGRLGRDAVLALAAATDHPTAQAIVLPDTALHTVAWIDSMESMVRKPVLAANQVTMWQALILSGYPVHQAGLGALFST